MAALSGGSHSPEEYWNAVEALPFEEVREMTSLWNTYELNFADKPECVNRIADRLR